MEFRDEVTSLAQLREIIRPPSAIVAHKEIDHIDEHCRAFIERSPFVLIATSDGAGNFDISPKGDPPGFVRILDPTTLAIPERPGNHRADTFTNVLAHPHVGLIFLVPGTKNTLRVSGSARIVADRDLCTSMAIDDRVPKVALVVDVTEAFLHCAKCIIRSKLWADDHAHTIDVLAEAMVDHAALDLSVAEMRDLIENDERERLY